MDIYKAFFDAVITGGAHAITEVAYMYFQRPIIVVDMSYKKICQLPNELVSDAVFDSILTNKCAPADIIWLLEDGKYRHYLSNHPGASFIDWGTLPSPRILGTVKIGSKSAGYYGIIYKDGRASDEDIAVAKIFGDALSAEFQKEKRVHLCKDELGVVIMRDIISGNITGDTILTWKRYSNAFVKSEYQIICAKSLDNNIKVELEFVCREVCEKFNNQCFSIVKDDLLYILFYSLGKTKEKTAHGLSNIVNEVIEHLKPYNIACGISEQFYDISLVQEHKFMAEDALIVSVEDSSQGGYPFHQYALRCMVNKIMRTEYHKIYIHPALNKLIAYDREYSTNYAETLRTYMITFKDLSATSAQLNIHRNTLKYRLQKIVDISGIDFNDNELCTQVLINFYML